MSIRRRLVVLIVAGQLLLLVGLIAWQEYKLHAWRTIRLQVRPVDPVALFRGRYVDLAYDFSALETAMEADLKSGDTVYVRLKPGEHGLWRYAGFTTKGEPQPGGVLLRGEVVSTWRRRRWIRTGIESYFLSERQAPAIEGLSRVQYKMTVDVVVADDGRASLKQLYVGGTRAEDVEPQTKLEAVPPPPPPPPRGAYELVTGKAFEDAVPGRFYLEGNAIPIQKRNAALVKTPRGVRVLFALLDTRRYSSQLQEKYKGMVISEEDRYIRIGGQYPGGDAAGYIVPGSCGFGLRTPPADSSEDAKFFLYDQGGHKFAEVRAKRDSEIKQPRPLQVVVDKAGSARIYLGRYWLKME